MQLIVSSTQTQDKVVGKVSVFLFIIVTFVHYCLGYCRVGSMIRSKQLVRGDSRIQIINAFLVTFVAQRMNVLFIFKVKTLSL